jgi:hypothetical protein
MRRLVSESQNQTPSSRVTLLASSFATIAFQEPSERAYDLQLDHWGICRKGDESVKQMRRRFEMDSGPVGKWLRSKHNGFYDNSIEGVQALDMDADDTSSHVYYFSLSFHATMPFPTEWPTWTLNAVKEFPMPLVGSINKVVSYIPLSLGSRAINSFLGSAFEKLLSSLVSVKAVMGWSTASVAKNFLLTMGIDIQLPQPGEFLPRQDVFPPMMATCYAMSGVDLTPKQRTILGDNLGDWHLNDGIVNTESMRGPSEKVVKSISEFPFEKIHSADARGVYWHVGTNDTMDHADEIGVFISSDTVSSNPSSRRDFTLRED